MKEQWKTHPVYSDYALSDMGRAKRLTPKKGTRVGKILKGTITPYGYVVIDIGGGTMFLHVAILEAFKGPRPLGMESLHLNHIKHDNRAANLSWGTHTQNYSDRRKHGGGNHGSRHGLAKLTESNVVEIRSRYKPRLVTQAMLAEKFNVSKGCIKLIVNNKRWNHV